ncbi:GlxA family transcriptional regulator [Marinobacter sp. X15-166B]|uniref:GlxA family transcriptional regulator n=1 Tax=Marinobacter sp. X15-166B TaxID=1897620 RepID=UPI00085C3C0C|nr:helix-turn-helix domain-containing protein [Marinobacter sp. X15-166B]OEY65445.1 AraC family transcriptional regulator [Marinobacter sp. X15-166B]
MSAVKEKRQFSSTMRSTNSAFLPAQESAQRPVRVAFVLHEHFSLMAFTAAVDVLVTANLVRNAPVFAFTAYGLDTLAVKSDLGIDIAAGGRLEQLQVTADDHPDVLMVCGGFRCSLAMDPTLDRKLREADRHRVILGGLWNGAVALAHAGVLDNKSCALHRDNHAYMRETFANVRVSDRTFLVEDNRATSAGAVSALEMMLALTSHFQNRDTVRAIEEILSCDRVADQGRADLLQPPNEPELPELLQSLLQVMGANIEEPLTIEELATASGVSRRRIERLFQTHLDTSPSRYYLELRITHARRLLLQSGESIANIAAACGFVSSTHFSHCYKDYFGVSPSLARAQRG